jgi:hypothetical protein
VEEEEGAGVRVDDVEELGTGVAGTVSSACCGAVRRVWTGSLAEERCLVGGH